MVFFSSRISPLTSTVIFLERSPSRDRGRHLGDVADLDVRFAGHEVDVVGQVLPGAGDALDLRLAAQLALGADFARDAGDFRGERAELVHHRVDDLGRAQELAGQRPAVDLERHALRQVALRHRADDARDFGGRLHQVRDQRVDRLDRGRPLRPRPFGSEARCLMLPRLADDVAEAFELLDQLLVALMTSLSASQILPARPVHRGHPGREVAAPVVGQDLQQPLLVQGLCRAPQTPCRSDLWA